MKLFRKILTVSVSVALAGTTTTAGASGFALIEQNASGLGNAYAGQAASAQDASTIFFNPAGMTLLPGRQVVGAINAIGPKAEFSNTGTTPIPLQALGSNGGNAGDWAFVPNAYLSWQLTPSVFVGVGLNAPFGLKTEYSPEWMGRYHGITSELKTININPSIAYKVNDVVSLGFGVNYQRVSATLSNAVNYSGAVFGTPLFIPSGGAGVEGIAKVQGDDNSWGYNAGVMFTLSPATRVGLAYRSAISHNLTGTVGFSNRPAAFAASPALSAALADGAVTADLKLPDIASASLFHKVNPQWDILADATWTGWSTVQTLNIVRTTGALLASTPLNYQDTWRVSLGANYHVNDAWTLRGGVAYDQTPVPDFDRTVRIPDGNRTWLALGGQYRISKDTAVDFGYAHLFVADSSINQCSAAQAAANIALACAGKNTVTGSYSNNVNIVSLQVRMKF